METLRRQVRRAYARMMWQSFLSKLTWCWFATLLVAAGGIAAARYWPPANEQAWVTTWLASSLAIGAVAAIAWTWATRTNTLAVAVELDRRFGLKERVSSTLALTAAERESEIGQALVDDAIRRVERIDVPVEFGLRLQRAALLPLLPIAAIAGLVLFGLGPVEQKKVIAATDTTQIKKSAEMTVKRLEEKRKAAEQAGLEEVNDLLAELERGTKDLAEKTPADRKAMMQALNDLARDAEKRREKLAGTADIKQQLSQLKNMQSGPAQKMAAALKNGDLKKAIDEIDKLTEKMLSDKLTPTEKQDLAKQLDQMRQALEKTAQAHKKAQDELKQQIEKERKAGNMVAADKLQQQLDKLTQKSEQMEKLEKMAAQLKEAGAKMEAGQSEKAAAAMAQMANELKDMAQEMDELAMLDSAMDDLGDWKNAMSCKECEGEGCANCQGGKRGMQPSDKFNLSDFARNGGIGAGKREKKESDTGLIDSQVPQNVGRGAMIIKGSADGPNRKGQAQQAIKEEFSGAAQQSAETLTDQRLPHDYRDHTKGYFEALREGQK